MNKLQIHYIIKIVLFMVDRVHFYEITIEILFD